MDGLQEIGYGSLVDLNLLVLMNLIENTFVGAQKQRIYCMFVNLYLSPMHIYGTWVDFDQPHGFISEATSPTNIHGLDSSVTWPHQ
jgi:hypothetical protein